MLYHHLRGMVSVVVVVLWVYVQIDNRAFGMENGHTCRVGLMMHTDKAGQNKCCKNIECGPGTEAQLCDDSGHTSCIDCKPGTFQEHQMESRFMIQCQKHSSCRYDAVVIHAGSATTDVKCKCDLGSGFYGDWVEFCRIHGGCGPGQQPTLNGGCEPCPHNYYLNRSISLLCSPCSTCDSETQQVAINCSANSNTICSNKTLGHNDDKVDNSLTLPIILGVIGTVMTLCVLMAIIICVRKHRNEDSSPDRVSFSSASTSTSSEQDPANEQCKGNRLPQQVKENHQCWVGDTQQEAVSLISDDHLQRSSLCDSSSKSKPDIIGHHKRNASGEWLNSPSADLSSLDTSVSTSVNLVDERENLRGREDDQQSVEYVVVTADEKTDSLPSNSHAATVMRGNNNVQNGNIYHFENCNINM